MRLLLFAVAVISVLACDALPTTDPDGGHPQKPRPISEAFTSGSRLRARYIEAPGGARQFLGWYDSVRDVECEFEISGPANAVRRCLPLGRSIEHWYSDASCETVLLTNGDCDRRFFRDKWANCDGGAVVRNVGADFTPALAYAFQNGACVPVAEITRPVPARMCEVGDEVPLDLFVSAREAIEQREGPVEALVLEAEDGARQVLGGYDAENSFAATPQQSADGTRRWMPYRVAYDFGTTGVHSGSVFSESTCSARVALKDRTAVNCPLEAIIRFEHVGGCVGYTFNVDRIGTRLESAPWYRDEAGVCVADPRPLEDLPLLYHSVGHIPPDAMVPASSTLVHLKQRIALSFEATPAGPVFSELEPLYDTYVNQPCEPRTAADGVLRCLPVARTYGNLFVDSQCTRLGVEGRGTSNGCVPPGPPPSMVSMYSRPTRIEPDFETPMQVFLVDIHPSSGQVAAFRRAANGGCEPRSPGFSEYKIYPVLYEVPPETFVEVAERQD